RKPPSSKRKAQQAVDILEKESTSGTPWPATRRERLVLCDANHHEDAQYDEGRGAVTSTRSPCQEGTTAIWMSDDRNHHVADDLATMASVWTAFSDFSKAVLEHARHHCASSPSSILGASRRDPFDSLPLRLDDQDAYLFDFYATTMPTICFQSQFMYPQPQNWYKTVFLPEALKGAATFRATILVHAATCLGWMRGLQDTPLTLVQRTRSIQALRSHLAQHPDDTSDEVLTAILSAGSADDLDPRLDYKITSWMHMRALRRKIMDRGGPNALRDSPRLAMLVNWQDYIFVGYEAMGPSFHYEHRDYIPESVPSLTTSKEECPLMTAQMIDPSLSTSRFSPHVGPPMSTTMQAAAVAELQEQVDVLIQFLHSIESLSAHHRDMDSETLPPSRRAVFSENAFLYQALRSPLGFRLGMSGKRKQIISRMAALLTLHAALWDYRYSPSRIECYLRGYQTRLHYATAGNPDRAENAIQILLEIDDTFGLPEEVIAEADRQWPPNSPSPASDPTRSHRPFKSYEPETPAYLRPWFVGRMLKVIKRLNRQSWWKMNDYLFSLLTMNENRPCIGEGYGEELRQEILRAPLTSYIMPSMQ
ncbi:hypothetical protein KEM52_004035, partial [Ascosphaera acerosa]